MKPPAPPAQGRDGSGRDRRESLKRLCQTKDEVVIALPLVREALAAATGATLDCTADTMTLTIKAIWPLSSN